MPPTPPPRPEPHQTVNVGANVTLDGTASTDSEDATALNYAWALTASDPAGASIDLTNATNAEATFTATATCPAGGSHLHPHRNRRGQQ